MWQSVMKMRKKYIRACQIVCGLLILLHMIPIPYSITFEALEIDTKSRCIIGEHTIVFDGYYYINLREDIFSGEIEISGYESVPEDRQLLDVSISREGSGLKYRYTGELDVDYRTLTRGSIYSGFLFSNCMIVLYDEQGKLTTGGGYSARDVRCLVTGVSTYEEAETVVYDYLTEKP